MLVTDVDGTLTGDEDALKQLMEEAGRRGIAVVPDSSRPLHSLRRTWSELGISGFPAQVGALGTEVEIDGRVVEWSDRFRGFDRETVDRLLSELGFHTNGDEFQTRFKASYTVPRHMWESVSGEVRKLSDVEIVRSGNDDFDVVPSGAGKQAPLALLTAQLEVLPERVVAAGDSMNDFPLLMAAPHRIVVANADAELRAATVGNAYHAHRPHAAGIREGLEALGAWI